MLTFGHPSRLRSAIKSGAGGLKKVNAGGPATGRGGAGEGPPGGGGGGGGDLMASIRAGSGHSNHAPISHRKPASQLLTVKELTLALWRRMYCATEIAQAQPVPNISLGNIPLLAQNL